MRFMANILLLIVLSAIGPAFGQDQSPSKLFDAGVAAYQKGDIKSARADFRAALLDQHHSKTSEITPDLLFNLGLIEYKSSKFGSTLGLWREALVEAPTYTPARQAILTTSRKLEHREISHNDEIWESIHNSLFSYVSLNQFMLATGIFLLNAGWLILRYLGKRRRAAIDEQVAPPFPVTGTLLGVSFLMLAILSAAKTVDSNEVRLTILPKKIEARSGPDSNATPLFELYEGLEVIEQQTNSDWIQVTYPGGPTGWVPKNTVFSISEYINEAVQ
jgi:hypothetical protein